MCVIIRAREVSSASWRSWIWTIGWLGFPDSKRCVRGTSGLCSTNTEDIAAQLKFREESVVQSGRNGRYNMGKQCERRSDGLIPGQGEPWSQAEESGIPGDVKLLKFSESGSGTKVEFGE